MQVRRINAYAYFGTKQFAVELPIICDSSLIAKVRQNPDLYERDYQNLSEVSPARIVNQNFGANIWDAVTHAPYYIGIEHGASTEGYGDLYSVLSLLGIRSYTKYLQFDSSHTYSNSKYKAATRISNVETGDYADPNFGTFFDCGGALYIGDTAAILGFAAASMTNNDFDVYFSNNSINVRLYIYPDDIIKDGKFNPAYNTALNSVLRMNFIIWFNNTITRITRINWNVVATEDASNLKTFLNNITIPDYAIDDADVDNPYGEDGTSNVGGGDGTLGFGGLDDIDPTDIPELPSLSAVATGFITMYNPSGADLSALGNFLWSGMFDLDTYKKLFADPMQGIIGLGIVPALPNSAGSRNIMFGNVDTGVNCSYLASQYATKDCGSVEIKKYVGSFLDYQPYVHVSLFIPYVGFVNLGTDDIMGGSINVKYNIDVLTGDCIAFIKHSTKGVLYAYHGNCLTNVPVSGQNYANALKNYYESVAGIIPATTNGAAGGPIGAIAGAATGALNAASNVVLNSKPTFQRSGNIGGSAGILGVQKPFVIIERPNISVPNKVQHYLGQTSNITMGLGECSGLTVVEAVHLNGISATSKELAEIDSLLKGGVIL